MQTSAWRIISNQSCIGRDRLASDGRLAPKPNQRTMTLPSDRAMTANSTAPPGNDAASAASVRAMCHVTRIEENGPGTRRLQATTQ